MAESFGTLASWRHYCRNRWKMKALGALASWRHYCRNRWEMKALGALASWRHYCRNRWEMKALGALAVAERDIRALHTARADTGPLRRLNCTRARLARSVHQEQQLHRRQPHASPADSLATLAHPSHDAVAA